jgi:hypothetical protein
LGRFYSETGRAAVGDDGADRLQAEEGAGMCRNIKMLFNFDPPVTEEEIRAASLQFVRKVSGFNKPSKANEAAFLAAVEEIAAASGRLLSALETNLLPRSREEEAARAKARNAVRFAK